MIPWARFHEFVTQREYGTHHEPNPIFPSQPPPAVTLSRSSTAVTAISTRAGIPDYVHPTGHHRLRFLFAAERVVVHRRDKGRWTAYGRNRHRVYLTTFAELVVFHETVLQKNYQEESWILAS
jgi:hypothetical protein